MENQLHRVTTSLEGAEFTVKYYAGLYDKQSDLPEKATRTWVLKTKKQSNGSYKALMLDSYKVSGDDFYREYGIVTLPIGTITIEETKAPDGYLLDNATLVDGNGSTADIENGIYLTQIKQNDTGGTAQVIAGNFPVVKDEVKKHHIEIEKVALDHNGQSTPLNGAQFTIKLKSEVAEKGWDNAQTYDVVTTGTINGKDGQAVTKDLPYGTYIGRETITPAGYVKADDIEFTIDQDISETSKVQHIKVTDEETHIRIYKYDIETDDALKNAEYLIFNVTENKEVGRYTTDQNGIIDLYKLPGGNTYYVQETKAPAGYKIDDTKYYFEFDKNGYVSISDMNDQSVNKDVFTINSNGDMQISLSNKLAYFNLNLNKINDSDLKLKGAEFTLYSDENCTKAVATGTTDKNGNLKFNNVEVGTYWLKETKAPAGYRKLLDPIKVEFRCENKEHTFFVNDEAVTSEDGNYSMTIENDMYTGNMTIVNKVGAQLPATGSNMTLMLVGAGCVIMLGAFALNKKKSKGKNNMKKTLMKKIGTGMLVSVLSLSAVNALASATDLDFNNPLVSSVHAQETGHITINANVGVQGEKQSLAGKKFNIYKIFDAENSEGMESINYTMNPAYEKSLKAATGKDTEYAIIDYIQTLNNYVVVNDVSKPQDDESRYSEFRYFVEKLRNQIVTDKAAPTQVVTVPDNAEDSYTLEVPYGWYIVDEVTSVDGTHSSASLCMVNTANPDAIFYIKSDYPTIQKQILEDDNKSSIGTDKDGWNDVADYEIGQKVPYRYNTYVPNINGYEKYYFAMHDKMDRALTFNKNSVTVTLGGKSL
ncbi:SpaA isopeptide-forming pilin-related protein [Coprobacillaceae bacterium CR2/5/TPMF4]|nr:SpaA isopeptide-forming pilin-related protein [Coprobacillaceae bacterium CR2/5/TPMF4]